MNIATLNMPTHLRDNPSFCDIFNCRFGKLIVLGFAVCIKFEKNIEIDLVVTSDIRYNLGKNSQILRNW